MNDLFFEISKRAKKRKTFEKTEEYIFFHEHRHLLDKFHKFHFLYNSDHNDFSIMRANIILHGLLNKKIIEEEIVSLGEYIKEGRKVDHQKFISTLRDKILELPYLSDDRNKIFIPFFTRAINYIYIKEPEKLLSYPYNELLSSFENSMSDPFDMYGHQLFNSYFTRLVLVGVSPDSKEAAYFHYDTNTIYFVNDQGRLDRRIILFDRYLKSITTSHMLEKIQPVVEAYFNHDKEAFLDNLYKGKFISYKMLNILRKRS